MDEFYAALLNVIQQVQKNFDSLTDEEAAQITSLINQATQFLSSEQQAERPIEPTISDTQRLLWILSGSNPEAFISYLRSFPDTGINALLRNPAELQNVIGHLQETMPANAPTQADGIPKAPLDSSNIYGFQYDPKTGNLLVRFQGGSIYGYEGVPPYVFRIFQSGAVPAKTDGQNQYGKWWKGKIPSLGAAFYNMIREGGYPYERVA